LEDGVFEEAEGPTNWLIPAMLVPKSDCRLRFVIDASPANKSIKRTRYVFPTVEDLITDINGANYYTSWLTELVVDACPIGLGAVLTQRDPESHIIALRIIAYANISDYYKNFQTTTTIIEKTMDFFVTFTSVLNKDQPNYETTWCMD
ncbi:unnamed protein product, partial [Brachionus calyciflorus]